MFETSKHVPQTWKCHCVFKITTAFVLSRPFGIFIYNNSIYSSWLEKKKHEIILFANTDIKQRILILVTKKEYIY